MISFIRLISEYRTRLKIDYKYDPRLKRHFWYVTPKCTVSMGRNTNAITGTSDYGTITFAGSNQASFRENALRALYAFIAIGVLSPNLLEEFATSTVDEFVGPTPSLTSLADVAK